MEILTIIVSAIAIIGFVYNFMRNFKNDMNSHMDNMEKRFDEKFNRMDNRTDALEERIFLMATGKTIQQALLEEEVKKDSKKKISKKT